MNTLKKLFPRLLLVIALGIMPAAVMACSVCFTAKEETLLAFYLTTAFLTLLPPLMISSVGIWVFRHYRKRGRVSQEMVSP